jgi:hypothetical protein
MQIVLQIINPPNTFNSFPFAIPHRVARRLRQGGTVDIQLGVDVVDVPLHRAGRQKKLATDFRVGEAFGNEFQHFQLALAARIDQIRSRQRCYGFMGLNCGWQPDPAEKRRAIYV